MEYALFRFLSWLFTAMTNDERIPLRRHSLRELVAYDVTEDELNAIESAGSDVGTDFQLALFSFTLSGSFLVNLFLTPPQSPRVFDVVFIVIICGLLFGLGYAIRWYRNRGAFSRIIGKIRDRQVGPVGEGGKELKPSDLAGLPSIEPPAGSEGSQ